MGAILPLPAMVRDEGVAPGGCVAARRRRRLGPDRGSSSGEPRCWLSLHRQLWARADWPVVAASAARGGRWSLWHVTAQKVWQKLCVPKEARKSTRTIIIDLHPLPARHHVSSHHAVSCCRLCRLRRVDAAGLRVLLGNALLLLSLRALRVAGPRRRLRRRRRAAARAARRSLCARARRRSRAARLPARRPAHGAPGRARLDVCRRRRSRRGADARHAH